MNVIEIDLSYGQSATTKWWEQLTMPLLHNYGLLISSGRKSTIEYGIVLSRSRWGNITRCNLTRPCFEIYVFIHGLKSFLNYHINNFVRDDAKLYKTTRLNYLQSKKLLNYALRLCFPYSKPACTRDDSKLRAKARFVNRLSGRGWVNIAVMIYISEVSARLDHNVC